MKKITLLVLLITSFGNAQIVNIPDFDFKDTLINSICVDSDLDGVYDSDADLNDDGEIQLSEAQSVISLNVGSQSIQSISGIESFTNLETLDCSNNFFNSIDLDALVDLRRLNVLGNLLTSLDVSTNTNLEDLDCSFNQITSLDVNFNLNLKNLNCASNTISSLVLSMHPSLETVICDNMYSLNALNVSECPNLISVKSEYCNLNSLNASSCPNLEYIDCFSNSLSALNLDQTPMLKTLNCSSNNLGSLSVQSSVLLEDLDCRFNGISSIDLSQNIALKRLWINGNNLATIDVSENIALEDLSLSSNDDISSIDLTQNINLLKLSSSYTQLSGLDVTQNINLQDLRIPFNEITSLDLSQNPHLQYLYANNNLLSSLDLNQNPNLVSIRAEDNNLLSLFLKNGNQVTSDLSFDGNDELQYICADESDMFIVNLRLNSYGYSNTIVNMYCSFEPGGDFNIITGNISFDVEGNDCDPSNIPQPHFKIDITNGENLEESTFTGTNGNYFFYTQEGSFDISPNVEQSSWFNVSPVSATIPFPEVNNDVITQDFCVSANGVHNDVEVVMLSEVPAQPGFDAIYQIVYKNKGNQMLSGTIDFTFDDAVLDYVTATTVPDVQMENNLSWDYSNLLPFESRVIEFTLNVNSPMETPAINNGDLLDFNVSISPESGDETPLNNSFDYEQIVVGSYDPNDITCLEGDLVNPEHIGEYLHYNINFENTGTAAATFIVVKDEIDNSQLDISTLQVLYTSHEVMTRIVDDAIEFVFDDINLVPEGKGNVVFKIKTNDDLVLGDFVENKADIFFDYNFPIETNVATTVFDILSINEFTENGIVIFPNPSSNIVNVRCESTINAITIYDVQGREIKSQEPNRTDEVVKISELNNGIYFLKVKTERGEGLQKIVKN